MKRQLLIICILLVNLYEGWSQVPIHFPLRSSAEGYLIDQDNKPVFLHGDSPWRLGYRISLSDARQYLVTRKKQGFNALIIEITPDLAGDSVHHGDQANVYGEHLFEKGALDRPNPLYFSHLDSILTLCEQMNFVVLLFPLYTGCCGDGWKEIFLADSLAVLKAGYFGQWLASRYRHLSNIVWISGGDNNEDSVSLACARAIAETDSDHLHGFHPSPGYTSTDRLPQVKWLNLDLIYTYFPGLPEERQRQQHVYAQFFREWKKKVRLPKLMSESAYEDERNSNPQILRRQAYWSLLSGASGHFFGQGGLYTFDKNWKQSLQTAGVESMMHFGRFLTGFSWTTLQPDWSETLVIWGRGSFNVDSSPGGSDYVTAAYSTDGELAIAYLPSHRSLGINLAHFAGPVHIKWFDPSNGQYIEDKRTFNNQGILALSPPHALNEQGFGDWLLVLETEKSSGSIQKYQRKK